VLLVHVLHVSSTLDHGQLLDVVITIAVGRYTHVAALAALVVAHLQVRQLLLCLVEFVVAMFLSGVNGRYLALLVVLGGKITNRQLVRVL